MREYAEPVFDIGPSLPNRTTSALKPGEIADDSLTRETVVNNESDRIQASQLRVAHTKAGNPGQSTRGGHLSDCRFDRTNGPLRCTQQSNAPHPRALLISSCRVQELTF